MRYFQSNVILKAWIALAFSLWIPVFTLGQITSPEAVSNANVRETLLRPITLELRDSTLLEALFAIRDASGLNLIVGNEVTGTVNATFTNTPVHQVLDSLLLSRRYGYRIIGDSVAIISLDNLGDQLPLFETVVLRLLSTTSADLLPTVQSLLSPEGRVHSVASSNSLVIMDYPERLGLVKTQIEALEKAAQDYRNSAGSSINVNAANRGPPGSAAAFNSVPTIVRIFRPQYVPAAILAESLRPLLSPVGKISPLPLEDKLMVKDTAENVERIAQALTELDLQRPQVRISALIYDCGIEDVKRIGVNWRTGINGSDLHASGAASQSAVLNGVTSAVSAGSPNGALTINSLNHFANITGVIQCLNTADDSRLLADPNVVVMNHEAANIEIVTELPYQQLTQGIQGGSIGTTAFREAGVSLNVTPHIAQDGTISMVVNPRFSLLTGYADGSNAPIIDRRETTTTVRVQDGQTLVLGGLRQRTRITERTSIPGLSKIPYLGHLFRFKRNQARESELIVFITPQIVFPDYAGTCREVYLRDNVTAEIDQTPTEPIPFGMHVIEAEDRAKERAIDRRSSGTGCQFGCGGRSSCDLKNDTGFIE